MANVLDKFYEEVRDEIEDNVVDEIELHHTDPSGSVVLDSASTDDDKMWNFEVQHGENRIMVEAVVSPSHADVDEATYTGSTLRLNGTPVTQEVSHTDAVLESEDDELTSRHYVEIPEQ